jgi:2-octaprenyl-6-methoxyphenol hydroxylase
VLSGIGRICTSAFAAFRRWNGQRPTGTLEKTADNADCPAMTETSQPSQTYDVAVIGGGPAGLAAAIALADTGARVALVARRQAYADNRTTALLGGSTVFLDRLDVWRRCADQSAALTTMRLVDDTHRLIRAPEVKFTSQEIGLDAFGYNIANRELMVALEARADELSNLARIDDDADSIVPDESQASVHTRQGQALSARLIVGADGRQSLCRDAAGIEVKSRRLDQAALTFNIGVSRPHRNMSTEFHTPQGPCVIVPLPGQRCSVVWVASPNEAARLMALGDDQLSAAIEKQMHSILGRVEVEPGRHVFPLAIEEPRQVAKNRIVLVGEAAHVIPPIGAQGLNMGLRDAADIADIVGTAMSSGEDIGAAPVLARFEKARRSDISSRTFAIDMANRSLLSDLLPVQLLRGVGMQLMGSVGPLRRLAMREGLAPSWRRSALGKRDLPGL